MLGEIVTSVPMAAAMLAICFLVLTKCASWFVEGAVGIAQALKVPKMLIGIVLVSLATTAPELAVSVLAALGGKPEMALGNAVGSVIVDDTVALGLGALLATAPIAINPFILRTTGIFLVVVDVIAYAMAWDGTLDRAEGSVLLVLFLAYTVYTYVTRKRSAETEEDLGDLGELGEIEEAIQGRSLGTLAFWFCVGLIGVLLTSEGIVDASFFLAVHFGVSEAVIGLTVVAIGTSLPEIATAVAASRKGHGEIVIGNILGADILNICWIAGASAVVNPLVVQPKVIHFMFPAMLAIVLTVLIFMRTRHKLSRREGGIALSLYLVYLLLMLKFIV